MKTIKYRVQDIRGNWYELDTDVADGIETRPGTLDRCTGVKDIMGNLIFEGDILCPRNDGKTVQPTRLIVKYIEHELGFCVTDASCIGKGYIDDWKRVSADELSIMLVVGNVHDNAEEIALGAKNPEMTKTIYKLTVDVWTNQTPFRHVELFFDKESQALKVCDRFKEHYHKIGFTTAVEIEETTLFLNANGYHGV